MVTPGRRFIGEARAWGFIHGKKMVTMTGFITFGRMTSGA
jgi:hypothetical protein